MSKGQEEGRIEGKNRQWWYWERGRQRMDMSTMSARLECTTGLRTGRERTKRVSRGKGILNQYSFRLLDPGSPTAP